MKKLKYAYRVRIAKDIIAEVMPPARASNKMIILCSGLPSIPAKRGLIDFLSKKGFWVFYPRYRGTWESGGQFLKKSPVQDINDVICAIQRKVFTEEFELKRIKLGVKDIYVLGSSFGGAVALCVAGNPNIKKVVVLSPVVDFRNNKGENMQWLGPFVRRAFGAAFRFSQNDWKRLAAGKISNPVNELPHLEAKKIFIMHSRDDRVVNIAPVRTFARTLGCLYKEFRGRGHMSLDLVMEVKIWRQTRKFLK